MLHVILFRPEIPPNTGNVIRLCANTGAGLHLIRPLGFELDDTRLRRAGLDYHEYARVAVHDDLDTCLAALNHPRVFALSTRGRTMHADARFADGDALLFGCETAGLPDAVLQGLPPEQRCDCRCARTAAASICPTAWRWRCMKHGVSSGFRVPRRSDRNHHDRLWARAATIPV
jgi:tRNA (cytidine/uridine-2'-O-)-methyltransferase